MDDSPLIIPRLGGSDRKAVTAVSAPAVPAASPTIATSPRVGGSYQTWPDRYAPQTLDDICGHKAQIAKLLLWLTGWNSNLKSGFTNPGKDGIGIFRAVMISGPPGIGKTATAHLCAAAAGFTPIEFNASDARSKRMVDIHVNTSDMSLDSWTGRATIPSSTGVAVAVKTCLIMDEVDGMSSGDRGGAAALAARIRTTKVPVICIANDRGAQKLKPLVSVSYNMVFSRPDTFAVRSRILNILYRERVTVPAHVVDQVVQGTQSDIRQVLNMLEMWTLLNHGMGTEDGKSAVATLEQQSALNPFGATHRLFGPRVSGASSTDTLEADMDLYFHDPALVPLFVQENYLKTTPSKLHTVAGPRRTVEHLELMDKAARCLSDADVVDASIHGSAQAWSLMPLHAIRSTVHPASLMRGNGLGYTGPTAVSFPQWLGQNARQTKVARQLIDVQTKVRLITAVDGAEFRLSYVPGILPRLVWPLVVDGARGVEPAIRFMDQYALSREDWDAVVDAGVGDNSSAVVLKKIPAAAKASFTKRYNSRTHPVASHKARPCSHTTTAVVDDRPYPDLEEVRPFDDDTADDGDDALYVGSRNTPGSDALILPQKITSAAGRGGGVRAGRGRADRGRTNGGRAARGHVRGRAAMRGGIGRAVERESGEGLFRFRGWTR